MLFSVEILADSITVVGARITTFAASYWRFVHPTVAAQHELSTSTASHRAIPLPRMIADVQHSPAMPVYWGRNQSGVVAPEELEDFEIRRCRKEWLRCRDEAVKTAQLFDQIGLHKQHANNILEPYAWATVIITATDFDEFFETQCSGAAQPEMQILAVEMRRLRHFASPKILAYGDWHVPLARPSDAQCGLSAADLRLVAAARIARFVSDGPDGTAYAPIRDFARARRMIAERHLDPFEHIAEAHPQNTFRSRNLTGYTQLRALIP